MTSNSSSAPGFDPVAAGINPIPARWMRPLGVAAIAVVVITAFRAQPGPGLTGDHLAVSVALVVFAVATLAVMRPLSDAFAVQGPIFVVAVLAAATLFGLQPNGPGLLGVFPVVISGALNLPTRRAALLTGFAIAALAVAWAISGGDRPVIGIVLNEFGVVAFFVLALFARRNREANDRAHRLIVELNETRAAQAEAAALGERQRLAREMHDVLAHSLSGLALNLEGARLMAERADTDPHVTEAIHRAQRLAKSGLEEARNAIGMLRGDSLPDLERLAALAAEFEADTGITCEFALEGPRREIAADVRLTVYRVAQEALTNIRKHAQPERVEVRLRFDGTGTELTIEDHRAGGDQPAPGDGTGYGLTGMRERAELLGGTLTAAPTARGFRVALWIPT